MARKKPEPTDPTPFCLLSRAEQLRDLLAQRQRLRAETAAYLADLAHWNQTQAARGEPGLGRDLQVESQLDWIEKQIGETEKAK
jgi:hypothetical protein